MSQFILDKELTDKASNTMTVHQSSTTRYNSLINELLHCPECSHPTLRTIDRALNCEQCGAVYPIINHVPVFIADPGNVAIISNTHISNPVPDEMLDWLGKIDGYSLNIGAGATQFKIPTCIELEYAIFKTTDVVADSHHLPFKDNSFEAVVALNVFEHLSDPVQASREIFRVLKPGGRLIIRTAFLQPLHEAPYHYYNATKYGVIQWFSNFQITSCHVSDNFNPVYTIAWSSCEVLNMIEQTYGAKVREKVAKTTLKEWSILWSNPNQRKGWLWDLMHGLPRELQERLAAGFELEATKPAAKNALPSSTAQLPSVTFDMICPSPETHELLNLDDPEVMQSEITHSNVELQGKIYDLEAQIRSMRATKFWKLRERWVKIKATIGLR